MKIKIKPCPFCGGHPNVEYTDSKKGQVYIACSECETEQRLYKSLDEAAEAWNRRFSENEECGE